MVKLAIVPGNGCTPIRQCNWYAWLQKKLQDKGYEVALEEMPDPMVASESEWIPFMENSLKCDENTIVVGHSSGAVAAMRYAEKHKVAGIFLVSACWTDLGEESERIAGYYSRPWQWDAIKKNTDSIVQLHSDNDPFIPVGESRHVAEHLSSEYHELSGEGHYMEPRSSVILNHLTKMLEKFA